MKGTWNCTLDPEADGPDEGNPRTEWVFTFTEDQMLVESDSMSYGESLSLEGSLLTLTDLEPLSGLQNGYDAPVTLGFPGTIPEDGDVFKTAIDLPNGDRWNLEATKRGGEISIYVTEPHDEQWECRRG